MHFDGFNWRTMDIIREYLSLPSLVYIISHEEDDSMFIWFIKWFSLLFIMYFVAFNIFKESTKILIKNKNIPKLNQWRLINALWRLVFSCLCVAVYQQHLLKDLKPGLFFNIASVTAEVFSAPYSRACNLTSIVHEEGGSLHVLMYYVVPLTFFLHQMFISLRNADSPSIIPMFCFSAFLHATYSIRCLDLGVKVMFLLALDVGSKELARACLALKSRCKGFKGPPAPSLLRFLATPMFIFHILIRLAVDFYIYPTLIFSLPYLAEADISLQLPTAYVNIFLTAYFPWQILCSPVWSILEVIARPKGIERPIKLWSIPSLLLLPCSSPLLYELREIQMNFQKNLPLSRAKIRTMRQNLLSQGKKTASQNQQSQVLDRAGGLLSVVKCMTALKRKMRYRYERRLAPETGGANSSKSNLPEDSEDRDDNSSVLTTNQDAQQPSDEDVTDIFIPVPDVSQVSQSASESEQTSTDQDSSTEEDSDIEEHAGTAETEDQAARNQETGTEQGKDHGTSGSRTA